MFPLFVKPSSGCNVKGLKYSTGSVFKIRELGHISPENQKLPPLTSKV